MAGLRTPDPGYCHGDSPLISRLCFISCKLKRNESETDENTEGRALGASSVAGAETLARLKTLARFSFSLFSLNYQ